MATLAAPQSEELVYEDSTPTPAGWKRKLIPYIGKGLVPSRIDVIFVAPTGDELKSKAQLQRYLKKNKASISLSEFIWSTDEGPRRSSRSSFNHLKAPPRILSKEKPATKVPLQESKAGKRSRPEKVSLVVELLINEDQKQQKENAKKVTRMDSEEDLGNEALPVGSDDDVDNSLHNIGPTKAHKKRKKQLKKDANATVKSNTKGHSTSHNIQAETKDELCGNGNEEKIKENRKPEILEENGKDDVSDQQLSSIAKDEEIQETKAEMHGGSEVNNLKGDMDSNGTTPSLLCSDIRVEGMEANCDLVNEARSVCEENINGTATNGEHANVSEGS